MQRPSTPLYWVKPARGDAGSNPVVDSEAEEEEEPLVPCRRPVWAHDLCKRNLGRVDQPGGAHARVVKGGLLNPSQRRRQAADWIWRIQAARGFESRCAHVNESEQEKAPKVGVLVEDGITFLSQRELDDYREQKIMLAWEEHAYA